MRITPGSVFGFVEFERHQDAVRAIASMEGFGVGGNQMRLTWGNHKTVRWRVGAGVKSSSWEWWRVASKLGSENQNNADFVILIAVEPFATG